MEVVIPVEIKEPSRKTEATPDKEMNDTTLHEELDLVEEIRTGSPLIEASLKQKIAMRYDAKVIRRGFEIGSLILKRNHK